MEKLLSARQVAEHLGMHPKTLYKALRGNRMALKFIRRGRTIVFRPRDVEAYLMAHEVMRTGDGPRKRRKESFETKMRRKYNIRGTMTDEEARLFLERIQRPQTEEEWSELAVKMDDGSE